LAFTYTRRVAFSDTDAMGVVHHANYLRFCEEARVAWMRENGLSAAHFPRTEDVLAVLHYQVWHLKTATFEDQIKVSLQVRRQGLKIHFQYAIYKLDNGEEIRVAEAETLHIPVNGRLKPVRPAPAFLKQLEKEPWIETWLSNS
jgi:acyl-CoA thioester hydrolase